MFLIFNNSFSDKNGIEFVTSEQPNMTTSKAAVFTKRADISTQVGIQKTSTSSACGVFVDNLLRAVRTDVLLGESGAYKIFNLNATLANLTPKNKYSVKVACIKRTIAENTLDIGTAVNTTFLNSDMSQ